MKKNLAAAVIVMMTAALAGCGGSGTSSETTAAPETTAAGTESGAESEESSEAADGAESQAEGEKTTFTVGFDADLPPMGFMDDDGNYVGRPHGTGVCGSAHSLGRKGYGAGQRHH